MENSIVETEGGKSIRLNKFTGLLIASLIVLVVYLVPAIPLWVAVVAAYPLLTSIVDIYLEIVA